MMVGQPCHHDLLAANEILHRLQRYDIAQAGMRGAAIGCDRIFNQLLQLIERHVEAQVSLRIGQFTPEIARMGTRVPRQS